LDDAGSDHGADFSRRRSTAILALCLFGPFPSNRILAHSGENGFPGQVKKQKMALFLNG
jgi:hypothetical protein